MSTATLAGQARHRTLAPWMAPALLALAAGAAQAQSYPVYSVKPLPISSFTAFNDQGLVLGRGFLPCTGLCTLSDSAVLVDSATGAMTGLAGGFGANPQFGAINAKGQVAGTRMSYDASGALVRSLVVRQPDGSLTTGPGPSLPATMGLGMQVRGLNANGQVALQYGDGLDTLLTTSCGSNYASWLGHTAGAWQALGPAGTLVSLSGINAGGMAAGAAVASANCASGAGYRAVAARADGSLVHLHGSLPGVFSRAWAINDLGYAVGEYDSGVRSAPDAYNPQGVPLTRAVVWNTASQTWYDMGPAGSASRLNAANARGEVVGRATGPVSASQPLTGATTVAMLGNLATNWPMVNLNTLLAGNTTGWVLQEALAINASGQIVARGHDSSGSGYALLTPVQPPADPYALRPSAPASLSAVLAPSPAVQLAWTPTARNATRLVVERCRGSNCTGFVAVATLAGDASRWLDAGTMRRTTYRYRARAGNAAGLSAPGNTVTITTLR